MIVAWIFEWTPEGLRRTDEMPPSPANQTEHRPEARFCHYRHAPRGDRSAGLATLCPATREKSIAVLPFEILSVEKENALLADGIQDDLLTNLARIKALKVISRTSVMKYRKTDTRNIQEIGKSLGAADILEGSVRRFGDRIAVNVQLIDSSADRHIWAERYDRKIADAVGIEGELATEIAEALRATLTPEEKIRVEQKPTQNADAYVLYLRALPYEQGAGHAPPGLQARRSTLYSGDRARSELRPRPRAPGFNLRRRFSISTSRSIPGKQRRGAKRRPPCACNPTWRKATSRSASASTGWTRITTAR